MDMKDLLQKSERNKLRLVFDDLITAKYSIVEEQNKKIGELIRVRREIERLDVDYVNLGIIDNVIRSHYGIPQDVTLILNGVVNTRSIDHTALHGFFVEEGEVLINFTHDSEITPKLMGTLEFHDIKRAIFTSDENGITNVTFTY